MTKITDKHSLYDAMTEGYRLTPQEDKKGVWRGGSVGCLTKQGYVIGGDPRAAVLRFLGISTRTDYDTQLMFDSGLTSEDSFAHHLKAGGGTFLREEEIPVKYQLPCGDWVTGRPDIVIVEKKDSIVIPDGSSVAITELVGDTSIIETDGTTHTVASVEPVLGIELKSICSPWVALKTANWGGGEVKPENFVQSVHYSSQIGVPWVLVYTNRGNYAMPHYVGRNEDKWLTYPDHRAILRDEKGVPFMIKPFQSMYDIDIREGVAHLDNEPTKVTVQGIEDFYEYCAECVRTKTVPVKRGGGYDHWGEKLKKNKTLQYDEFKAARTDSWENWIEDCKEIAERSKNNV